MNANHSLRIANVFDVRDIRRSEVERKIVGSNLIVRMYFKFCNFHFL